MANAFKVFSYVFVTGLTLGVLSACSLQFNAPANDSGTTTISAPSQLRYSSTNSAYTLGVAVTANTPSVTGTVSNYSVSPALPSGLSLDSATGVISGTPTRVTSATNYTVTAANSAGSAQATVRIATALPYKMWIVGGWNGAAQRDVLTSSDGEVWTDVGNYPVSASDMCLAVFDDKLYSIGGYNGTIALSAVYSTYNGVTWTAEPSLPGPMQNMACLVVGSRLYVFGGNDCNNNACSTDLVLSIGVGETAWQDAGFRISSVRSYMGYALFGGSAYFLGGMDVGGSVDIVESTPDGESFTVESPLPSPRFAPAVSDGSQIYVISGLGDTTVSATSDGTNWGDIGAVDTSGMGHGVYYYKEILWMIGGDDGGGTYYDRIQYSADSGANWTTSGSALPMGIGWFGYVVY